MIFVLKLIGVFLLTAVVLGFCDWLRVRMM